MAESSEQQRERLEIRGIVQGVGFRPFVHGLARRCGLGGFVRNHTSGVTIEIEGSREQVERFARRLREELPAAAVVDSIDRSLLPPVGGRVFAIVPSRIGVVRSTPVSPDLATCDACFSEFYTAGDRRFRYPFINCTDCGPRYTIIREVPYDRPQTTMSSFEMCAECQREYDDPSDRRYHAQPNACPQCGPRVWLIDSHGGAADLAVPSAGGLTGESAIAACSDALGAGKVVAIKGIGGFHLACSAANDAAVERLRQGKGRSDKPFAVMAKSVAEVKRFAVVSDEEARLLCSSARPIVLLRKLGQCVLSERVAPQSAFVGVMLPYSPLHALLVEAGVLVLTSGNVDEEPIARTNREAWERLRTLADCFLLHDREIHVVCDDSVVRVFRGDELPVRRSRGYAPMPVRLSDAVPAILAVGAELKSTFCVTRDEYAYVSPHIGDMGNLETLAAFNRAVEHYERLFRVVPERVVCDLHPGYLSSQWARRWSVERGVPLLEVQHHHAHVAGVLLEHGRSGINPVIGVSLDGTGYGSDGKIWGGEFLIVEGSDFRRWGFLREVRLPGGDGAIRHPYRAALAHLWSAGIPWDDRLPSVSRCTVEELRVFERQLESNLNCAGVTSMGRLFDAVGSLVGLRHSVTYEAQGAMELEACCDGVAGQGEYRFALEGGAPCVVDWEPVVRKVVKDVIRGDEPAVIACRFHSAIAAMVERMCRQMRESEGIETVVLSGGVFQNLRLLGETIDRLERRGFEVLIPRIMPANDGGLALGQIAIALWK